jgi:P2-related tail formation protein
MGDEARLFAWLDQLDNDDESTVTSVRQPAALRAAVREAVRLGMDSNANDATVHALRDRVETFAQRLALEAHYQRHPDARPSLMELAVAAAELDGNDVADDRALLARAAAEVVTIRPEATADDVLLYAAALQSRATV